MISFVVPIYNEEESIDAFYKALVASFLPKETYEIIFVDDGSTDTSLNLLKDLAAKDKRIRIFSFRKNMGKAEALTLGFHKAKGDYVVTLDADLQDKPSEVASLLAKAKEGWDVVSGWRKDRKDSVKKVISSRLFNYAAGRLWGLQLHDYNCGLKIYTQEAAKSLRLYGGMHRFIPLIAFQQGFNVTELPIAHDIRRFGKSKYGFSKIFKDFPDMFTMFFLSKYSKKPFHFFGIVGGLLFLIGFFVLGYLTILRLMGESIGRRPLLFFGMLLVITGFQIFFSGFLADLMISLSSQQNDRRAFPLKFSSEK